VVRRSPSGPEIGVGLVAKRTAASFDPLFGSMPITPDVVQWHFDEVATLPPGAIQLYSAPACAQQAFRLGRLAWGIQFHIETTPEIVRRWADSDAGVLSDWDLDAVIAGVDAIDDDLVEVWQPFAADFARVVAEPAAVPAPRRMATASTAPLTDPAAIRAALAAEATGSRHPSGIPLGMPSPRTASSD
jgi:hypothetical protein